MTLYKSLKNSKRKGLCLSKIVLINGLKRSGKDYTASLLKQEIESRGGTCEIMSFAEPMKRIIAKIFGIHPGILEEYKNSPEDYGFEIRAYPNNQPSINISYGNFRKALQIFGTEAMKPEFGESVWADLLYKRAHESNADVILVPDFRFNIEYHPEAVTLKVVHSDLEAMATDLHASETELNDFLFNYYIDNTGYPDQTENIIDIVDELYPPQPYFETLDYNAFNPNESTTYTYNTDTLTAIQSLKNKISSQ